MDNRKLRVGFVIEDALGHITHAQGLRAALANDSTIEPAWMPVAYRAGDLIDHLPGLPFSVKLSLRARSIVRQRQRQPRPPDCLYFHTQGLTPCCLPIITRTPSVISLDATPENFRSIAPAYGERPASGSVARLKTAWFRAVFARARGLVAFSAWVRDSLVSHYSVDAAKVTIVPPGVDTDRWRPPDRGAVPKARLRLLFVGADFERKGGALLLQAWRSGLSELCEIDIVTRDTRLVEAPGLRVHRNLSPNMPALMRLYAQADVFALPSLGDASPFAVLEAMASGLPVLATRVGAISEMVEHGLNGWLIEPGDATALAQCVAALARDRGRLAAMGRAARACAEQRYHAPTNYARLLGCIRQAAALPLASA